MQAFASVQKLAQCSNVYLAARRFYQYMLRHARSDDEQLFRYTSGRWLWNEKQQLEARYRSFDVSSLKTVACDIAGSTRCTSLRKIGEGSYNKAFRLVMQDRQTLIAKIPNPNAGPVHNTTASEVATMDFARTILGLPVPKVLAWSATTQNPVQSEYILMEEARGSPLHTVWPDMDLSVKEEIVHQIVDIEKKMLAISFDKYDGRYIMDIASPNMELIRSLRIGSLYFKDSGLLGCESIEATTVSEEIKDRIESRFCIGPVARREFWAGERSQMSRYHGPWTSAMAYLRAVAERELDWISNYASTDNMIDPPWQHTYKAQKSPETHVSSLRMFIAALAGVVPKESELCSPRFWHPDLHAGNIYVDSDGKISSIIDWQSAWTAPLFIGANPPKLLDYSVDMMMFLPDNFQTLDPATKDRLRHQVAQSILIHSYEIRTARENALMHKMLRHPQGQTLKSLEAFANATWDNCLFSFRECLMRVQREWADFDSAGPCPIRFSEREIQEHEAQVDAFNTMQDLRKSVRDIVGDEGYTHVEDFEKASCCNVYRTRLLLVSQVEQSMTRLSAQLALDDYTRLCSRKPREQGLRLHARTKREGTTSAGTRPSGIFTDLVVHMTIFVSDLGTVGERTPCAALARIFDKVIVSINSMSVTDVGPHVVILPRAKVQHCSHRPDMIARQRLCDSDRRPDHQRARYPHSEEISRHVSTTRSPSSTVMLLNQLSGPVSITSSDQRNTLSSAPTEFGP